MYADEKKLAFLIKLLIKINNNNEFVIVSESGIKPFVKVTQYKQ
jgi:hypothetical protein